MDKKIQVLLKQNDNVLISDYFLASVDNNIIEYNDSLNNKFDVVNLKLERIDNEKDLVFDFLNQILVCKYNGNSFSINIDVIYKDISYDKVYIKYRLENDVFEYIINM